MPEGPECRRYALSLGDHIGGENLARVEVVSGRYLNKNKIQGLDLLKADLPQKVVGVGVHGKFIYCILENRFSMWSTLGMTGSWQNKETKHTRVKLVFESGKVSYFNDMRNFGTLKFCEDPAILSSKLQSLGPDLLAEDVADEKFISQMRKNNDNNITKAMMDQKVVAGIGNYIKAEALWLARISPHKKISEVSDNNLAILNKALKNIMRESFKSGGATIMSYSNFFGEVGNYSSRFMVYNQQTDPDGNQVIKETTPDGRTTHWVPEVQI